MSQIDPRFRAPQYLEVLSHFEGTVFDVRFVQQVFGTREASGLMPPPMWAGDAVAPRPRVYVPGASGVIDLGEHGATFVNFNRRGG
jgi:hypothetical protein